MGFMSKLLSFGSDKDLKRYYKIVDQINGLEPQFEKMTEEELRAQTDKFRERYANGESLDDMLPEAFATVREASKRTMGMRHFDVQLIGAMALHEGHIAEMKTGEGKTLVSTLAGYLNAIAGKGVHVVTVNDYLAKRDSEWMGRIYKYLGMTVGLLQNNMPLELKRPAYQADVTYGTNSEFGFDYLRDNMVTRPEQRVQRGHSYAIVDEVDSILIDEARTPLIISGKGEDSSVMYKRADDFAKTLKKSVIVELDDKVEAEEQVDGDYVVDEKRKTATLTESGVKKAEAFFHVENLADADNMSLRHYIDGAIKARGVMHRDTDYIVKDGEVIIVDEFTGRLMYGRRFNDGLHQAIEAKEGVTVAAESKTLATVTFQNYFRMYKKLSGMTGTASTEADEFSEIYGLNIVSIPTNKPRARKDLPDSVYKTVNGKYNAVIEQVAECHAKGQPVLVGTVSVEKSEALSKLLKKKGIEHNVLNAKQHEREAEIVAQAGKQGAVTIATNMAGRVGRSNRFLRGGNFLLVVAAHALHLGDFQRVGLDFCLGGLNRRLQLTGAGVGLAGTAPQALQRGLMQADVLLVCQALQLFFGQLTGDFFAFCRQAARALAQGGQLGGVLRQLGLGVGPGLLGLGARGLVPGHGGLLGGDLGLDAPGRLVVLGGSLRQALELEVRADVLRRGRSCPRPRHRPAGPRGCPPRPCGRPIPFPPRCVSARASSACCAARPAPACG